MENIQMAKVTMTRTGPKAKAPEEKTYPVTVYAVVKEIEEIGGAKLHEGALDTVREELRAHFKKLLAAQRRKK